MDLQTILKELGATMVILCTSDGHKKECIPYKFASKTNEFTKLDGRTIPPDTLVRSLEIGFSTDDVSSCKEEK